jgi:predicted dehydrogenase
MKRPLTRRRFMYGVATVAGATFAGPSILRAAEVGKEKLRIAYVGTGGRAGAHIGLVEPLKEGAKDSLMKGHACPAYCDAEQKNWAKIAGWQPGAKQYTDYRKMFEAHEKEIDAVFVATPDHNHACAAAIALRAGKHVYCEKPLTWSVAESRALAELTAEKKVATQMGNQGHSNEGNRRVVEWIRAGIIGDVTEVHSWTNRPIWPQGVAKRPDPEPVPATLDWDSWIGPAPFREYHKGLAPFAWRGYFDFGCGAIGDMGCHTWDCVFWAMQPDYPDSVELVEIVNKSTETWPSKSHVKWNYPAKGGRPGFVAHWYEGGLRPEEPEEFANDPAVAKPGQKRKFPASASMFVGTKGKIFVGGDYGESGPRLIPESAHKEVKRPEQTIPKSPGHHNEFVMAATGEKPWDFPGSNFATYAGPLTENMLLGAIAIRMGEVGSKFECDAVKRTIKTKEAMQFASREYRKGWPQVSPRSPIG